MNRLFFILIVLAASFSAEAQKVDTAYKKITNKINIAEPEVHRIISSLASDSMRGRGLTNYGAEIAAAFIENEYSKIGLEQYNNYTNYQQPFKAIRMIPQEGYVKINGVNIDPQKVILITDKAEIKWKNTDSVATPVEVIGPKDDFLKRLKQIEGTKKDAIVLVDYKHAAVFGVFRSRFKRDRFESDSSALAKNSYVFIMDNQTSLSKYDILVKNEVKYISMYNVVGMIPGKAKKDEYVIFSAHYDNFGYVSVSKGDSIANGADENASGVTAVIELAKYFKEQGGNERTLLFVNYNGETIGGVGSKYFSKNIDPAKVIAVYNIDAIGKESKFGPRSAFITGYDKSNLGEKMKAEGAKINFKFKPDPYKDQGLFYQAANTPLALLGVPSHTFSTVQIDVDRYLGGNKQRDDMNTIELNNMTEIIKAIAFASKDLVDGKFTPDRVTKLRDDPNKRNQ
ncbi:M28 family peptidase [Solitalea koreensis]|uniref:Peptidase family M28 n=1 Tax=Solitalea koreensis TaxID=543615 RepID=A0A521C9N5_9SPHI|nr:M28 family peptidase [Solitalea koreensis]SMO56123.1 Peptidase family M28 [Solitalea koreensis]